AGECEYVGPGGETLYTTTHATKDVRGALLRASIDEIVSLPAGPAAVMRADAYRKAGGYRAEFYFAQDLDLWIRMAALGRSTWMAQCCTKSAWAWAPSAASIAPSRSPLPQSPSRCGTPPSKRRELPCCGRW